GDLYNQIAKLSTTIGDFEDNKKKINIINTYKDLMLKDNRTDLYKEFHDQTYITIAKNLGIEPYKVKELQMESKAWAKGTRIYENPLISLMNAKLSEWTMNISRLQPYEVEKMRLEEERNNILKDIIEFEANEIAIESTREALQTGVDLKSTGHYKGTGL